MIYSLKHLIGKKINAIDGKFGTCKDFLFDDQSFKIRYLVVDTGNWLPGRKILIHPRSIESLDKANLDDGIPVTMSKERIELSPTIDADRPVSRQAEAQLHNYYGWQPYWFPEPVGMQPDGTAVAASVLAAEAEAQIDSRYDDPNLRSAAEVRGYSVRPTNNDSSGPLHDLLLDSANWTLKYAIVDTRSWFIGGHKIIPISSTNQIDYANSELSVFMTAEQIKEAPDAPSEKDPIPFEEAIALERTHNS